MKVKPRWILVMSEFFTPEAIVTQGLFDEKIHVDLPFSGHMHVLTSTLFKFEIVEPHAVVQ